MKNLKLFSLLMALVLTLSVFTSCLNLFPSTDTEQTEDSYEDTVSESATETESETESEKATESEKDTEESEDSTDTEKTDTEAETESAPESESVSESEKDSEPESESESEEEAIRYLNGVDITEYAIVYGVNDVDYSYRAAKYIRDQIKALTGVKLPINKDTAEAHAHEIVVGETSRDISATLDADTEGLQFALYADDTHIAMEGDYFIIAAAAYFFIDTYVTEDNLYAQVPCEVKIHEPIVKEAKNFMLLIGDGMGPNQTKLFEAFDAATEGNKAYSDGEDFFYGYLLPYQGWSITTSLSGTTDSAAGGTALATGYKTYNSRIGRDMNGDDIQSLTELAGSLGMGSAVVSTDSVTGATPSAFSAHANSRNDTDVIKESQAALKLKYGTLINCGDPAYTKTGIMSLESRIASVLNDLSYDEDGFFLMYEEATIDKKSHSSDLEGTFDSLVRFNQAIGIFMEYAFYHPDTFVLITADHETGGLKINEETGEFYYTSIANSEGTRNHTGINVPIFAYGMGAEIFNGATVENVEIPKQIANLMGVEEFGGPLHAYDYFT